MSNGCFILFLKWLTYCIHFENVSKYIRNLGFGFGCVNIDLIFYPPTPTHPRAWGPGKFYGGYIFWVVSRGSQVTFSTKKTKKNMGLKHSILPNNHFKTQLFFFFNFLVGRPSPASPPPQKKMKTTKKMETRTKLMTNLKSMTAEKIKTTAKMKTT